MLFSYVLLCDFFPLYDFQCIPSREERTYSNILLKSIEKRSISNITKINLTKNEKLSLNFGLQRHSQPTTSEIILDVWIFTLLCEEIRQVKIKIFFVVNLQIFYLIRYYQWRSTQCTEK